MNIAIITLFGYFNHGNRLQNYAMQEILKKIDPKINVDTLRFGPNKTKKSTRLLKKRKDNFKTWSQEHIKERYVNLKDKEKILNEYDFICIGSDQIFTPKSKLIFDLNFLDFIESNKKFTYAASFGRSIIPKDLIKTYKKGFSGFNEVNLSVRENQGRTLIKNLTNKDPFIHIDPTLILTMKNYEKIIDTMIEKDYILTYFLGKTSQNKINIINNIAKKDNLKVININDPKYYVLNSGKFLGLLKNAKYIFSDSYHGILFSIIFRKNFILIENRPKMRSRFNTLFNKFSLTDRSFETVIKLDNVLSCNILEIDYSSLNLENELLIEREKTFIYLKSKLGVYNGYRDNN